MRYFFGYQIPSWSTYLCSMIPWVEIRADISIRSWCTEIFSWWNEKEKVNLLDFLINFVKHLCTSLKQKNEETILSLDKWWCAPPSPDPYLIIITIAQKVKSYQSSFIYLSLLNSSFCAPYSSDRLGRWHAGATKTAPSHCPGANSLSSSAIYRLYSAFSSSIDCSPSEWPPYYHHCHHYYGYGGGAASDADRRWTLWPPPSTWSLSSARPSSCSTEICWSARLYLRWLSLHYSQWQRLATTYSTCPRP